MGAPPIKNDRSNLARLQSTQAQNDYSVEVSDPSIKVRASIEATGFEPSVGKAAPAPLDAIDQMKASTSLEDKKAFLQQFGIKPKHLKRAKPGEIDKAFAKALDSMRPGAKTKFRVKIGGQKYDGKLKKDANGNPVGFKFKEKKSFMDKLKKVGQIALTVAQFIPGPIGVVARVANAVMSSVSAIKSGNILGGIAGIAGAVAGGVGAFAGKAAGGVAGSISKVAGMVSKGANFVGGVASAVQTKNWGGLVSSLAGGAAGIAKGFGGSMGSFASSLDKFSTWATRGNTALQAAAAARNGDILGALQASTDLAEQVAPNSRVTDMLGDINSRLDRVRELQKVLGA